MRKLKIEQPIIINKLENLLKRCPSSHSKRSQIIESLRKYRSGYNGEQSLAYYYRYLPKEEVSFYPGLRILHDGYYFQMDLLVVTPHFLLIIEIKNHAGHLYFDDKVNQMIRTFDGHRVAFEDPVLQVNRQRYHLIQLMQQHKFPAIPIETLVVVANSSTIVEFSPTYKEAMQKVIKSPQLQFKFMEFQQRHKNNILENRTIKKLVKQLFKLHDIYNPDVCELFQIDKTELITGVLCSSCILPATMYYKGANWRCTNCSHTSKTAYIEALIDYAFLISPTITNRECKKFLHMPSTSVTTHLLKSLHLPYIGSTKSRSYSLLPLIEAIEKDSPRKRAAFNLH
ncbi:nuclease-related domain-containing protein [Fictibacillus nanhaiensis]|uniref:nuclease-related domain-containing protein n=1 Tax=Fictibacillus nanhaiensis TaxID=742169 RepID=UPI002E236B94|nr:nuclease-related domain-containing protein [Fictibacillus nanhaiensis]